MHVFSGVIWNASACAPTQTLSKCVFLAKWQIIQCHLSQARMTKATTTLPVRFINSLFALYISLTLCRLSNDYICSNISAYTCVCKEYHVVSLVTQCFYRYVSISVCVVLFLNLLNVANDWAWMALLTPSLLPCESHMTHVVILLPSIKKKRRKPGEMLSTRSQET